MTNQSYQDFLRKKAILDPATGIDGAIDIPAQMKPHQRDITAWALRRGRAAIFAGTGLGKTFMELAWAQNVASFTGKPVLIFAPLAVAAQHIREAQKFGIDAAIAADQGDIGKSPVIVTNYQKMDRFDLSAFGGIVLDECFAPDTMIDVVSQSGKIKSRKISEIQPGDLIRNASGTDVVSDVHRREVPYGVRVSYGGKKIICSPNHPFFTRRGWVGAQDLKPGDEIVGTNTAMRILQGNFRDKQAHPEEQTVLQSILLSEMADEATGNFGKGTFARSRRKTRKKEIGVVSFGRSKGFGRTRAYSITQPDVVNAGQAKSLPPIERHAAQTFRAWGQWSRNDLAAIASEGCTVRQLAGGICFVTGATQTRISNALQNRLGERRKANSYRSGWSLTSIKKADRREKGRNAGFIRVDGIEVLELGHPDLDRYRDAEGKLYFYDLGGTRHPSFSVNGGLVHNSSILKNSDGKYRTRLIEECRNIPFRLAATATPAPNDFMELGNHSEFLGVMSQTDMLAMFFTHDGGETQKWRLKGHAEDAFWRWMASWAVMLRNPSDLGYPSEGYDLPELIQTQHSVEVEYAPCIESGLLFPMEATTLGERLAARKDSVQERVALAAKIIRQSFETGLGKWDGNQNTQSVVVCEQKKTQNIEQNETHNPILTKNIDQTTCENTDQKTQKNGKDLKSNNRKSTKGVANVTHPIQNIENAQSILQDKERQKSAENTYLEANTNLHQPNTKKCSDNKMEFAASVVAETMAEGCTLTTATIMDTSEGFCAPHATQGLGNSKTISTGLNEQSNTSLKLVPWVVWCHLNSEQDAIKKELGDLAISIHGGLSDVEKLAKHDAWLRGEAPVLIVKPSMFGHGLNWQHCSNTLFVGLSDSFEQVYQAIRRFWRFGQTKPVNVHFIASEMEGAVVSNIRRKERDAERMANAMVKHMADFSSENIKGLVRDRAEYAPAEPMTLPNWIGIAT